MIGELRRSVLGALGGLGDIIGGIFGALIGSAAGGRHDRGGGAGD